jgi:hypothetical protein
MSRTVTGGRLLAVGSPAGRGTRPLGSVPIDLVDVALWTNALRYL